VHALGYFFQLLNDNRARGNQQRGARRQNFIPIIQLRAIAAALVEEFQQSVALGKRLVVIGEGAGVSRAGLGDGQV